MCCQTVFSATYQLTITVNLYVHHRFQFIFLVMWDTITTSFQSAPYPIKANCPIYKTVNQKRFMDTRY